MLIFASFIFAFLFTYPKLPNKGHANTSDLAVTVVVTVSWHLPVFEWHL